MSEHLASVIILGSATALMFIAVLWWFARRRMTRTVSGFLLWMLFTLTLALLLREVISPDGPIFPALVLWVVGGGLTYVRNYQLDHRPRLPKS